jgi:aminopeptidase-like protein
MQMKSHVKRGFVLTTCGGPGKIGYKSSFLGDDLIDFAVKEALLESNKDFIEYPFDMIGSDERQYSSPYFRIPCATISKDKYYEFAEYHTSLDNLDFVKSQFIIDTFSVYLNAIQNLELGEVKIQSLNPACEPFFTKRNLYSSFGVTINNSDLIKDKHQHKKYEVGDKYLITGGEISKMLRFLFWADGQHTIREIAKKTNQSISTTYQIASKLSNVKLVSFL